MVSSKNLLSLLKHGVTKSEGIKEYPEEREREKRTKRKKKQRNTY